MFSLTKHHDPLTITMDTANAAFDGEQRGPEIARILRKMADRLEARGDCVSGFEWVLYDVNGNHVGELVLSPREPSEDDEEA